MELLQNLADARGLAGSGLPFDDHRLSRVTNIEQNLVKIWRLHECQRWKPFGHEHFFD